MSTEDFDREINVRGVILSGLALVAVALAVSVVVWWLLRGFSAYDTKRDEPLTPIQAAAPQPPPPEPRLQNHPNEDMRRMRAWEAEELGTAHWANRQKGVVKVPIDVAIDVIAARGVSPQVVGGKGAPASPEPSPPRPRTGEER